MKDCCIVVTSYKEELAENEENNIKRLFSLYKGKFDICLVFPNNKKLDYYNNIFDFDNIFLLDPYYFEVYPDSYNEMVLSNFFYKLFSTYKYILIHHPDSYILKDELQYWIDKDYDAIGSPFIYDVGPKNIAILDIFKRYISYGNDMNGGLCLRKVSTFLYFTEKYEDKIKQLYKQIKLNEDQTLTIFSILQEDLSKFKFPKFTEAIKFAWSAKPYLLSQISNFELPFGLHAHETIYKYFYDALDIDKENLMIKNKN